MEINLVIESKMKSVFEEIFKSKNFTIKEDSEVVFLEKGLKHNSHEGIVIIFDPNDINTLVSFLDDFKRGFNENETIRKNNILGKFEDRYELVPIEKILFFEADGNNIYFKTSEKKIFKVKEKLYELENLLDEK